MVSMQFKLPLLNTSGKPALFRVAELLRVLSVRLLPPAPALWGSFSPRAFSGWESKGPLGPVVSGIRFLIIRLLTYDDW
jgi:hypothetical protein